MHYAVVTAYLITLILLMVYCLHRYYIIFLYLKYKDRSPYPKSFPQKLPKVTIQLPLYNEMYVVSRLLQAVGQMRYPKELLEIQVLDDSTDETSQIAQEGCDQLRGQGHTVVYLHRKQRCGFKAGALQAGLEIASGELIAIFDADFVPGADFLIKLIPYFSDSRVGMVQSRWGHINRDYSLLTELQAIFLDAHFLLEHTARSRSGRFFNFNGTAGIWRKECILSAGGWQYDTLTEDLDLSYRAQLKGWKFIFVPEVVTPAEVPVDMNSFKSQQHRWAKGGIETAKKLLPLLFKSRFSCQIKIESCYHLSNNFNYLLILLLSIVAYPALIVRIEMGWRNLLLLDLIFFLGATLPVSSYYLLSQWEDQKRSFKRFFYLPFLMALGIGLCVNNGRGVIEALWGHRSEFVRTPKFLIERRSDSWRHKRYQVCRKGVTSLVEIVLGFTFFSALLFALRYKVYPSIPFLLLFCWGFFYVSVLSIFQAFGSKVCEPGYGRRR